MPGDADGLAIFERIGAELGAAYALDDLSVLAWCRGDLGTSAPYTDQTAARYEHPFGIASVLHRRHGDIASAAKDRQELLHALGAPSPHRHAARQRPQQRQSPASTHSNMRRVSPKSELTLGGSRTRLRSGDMDGVHGADRR